MQKIKEFIALIIAFPLTCAGFAFPVFGRSMFWGVATFLAVYWCFEHFSRRSPWEHLLFTSVLFIFGLPVVYPMIYPAWAREQAASTTGFLQPSSPGKETGVKIRIGNPSHLGTTFQTPGSIYELPLVGIFGDSLTVKRAEGVLELSTNVRDSNGNLIVSITDNHWTVMPQYSTDKNFTNDTLEVKDSRDRVVLQAYIGADVVLIQGEWHDERHGNFRACNMIIDSKLTSTVGTYGPTSPIYDFSIPPEFNYPSSEHWGELRTQQVVGQGPPDLGKKSAILVQ